MCSKLNIGHLTGLSLSRHFKVEVSHFELVGFKGPGPKGIHLR